MPGLLRKTPIHQIAAPAEGPFSFMKLPPELRIIAYDMVIEYLIRSSHSDEVVALLPASFSAPRLQAHAECLEVCDKDVTIDTSRYEYILEPAGTFRFREAIMSERRRFFEAASPTARE